MNRNWTNLAYSVRFDVLPCIKTFTHGLNIFPTSQILPLGRCVSPQRSSVPSHRAETFWRWAEQCVILRQRRAGYLNLIQERRKVLSDGTTLPSSWARDSCTFTLRYFPISTTGELIYSSRLSVSSWYAKHAADRDTKGTLSLGFPTCGRTRFQYTVNHLQGRYYLLRRNRCA